MNFALAVYLMLTMPERALCEACGRLAYHGIKAWCAEPVFYCKFHTGVFYSKYISTMYDLAEKELEEDEK